VSRVSYPGGPPHRVMLENGMRVLAARHGQEPLVAVVLSLEAGSRFETDERAGLAALTAATVIEGSTSRAGAELASAVDSTGAVLDVAAGYESATFTVTGLAETIEQSLSILREIVASPLFDQHEFEEARRAQLAELAEDDDDPGLVCRRELFDAVYAGHPRHRPANGTIGSLRLLTREDLVGFHEATYRPQRAVVSVAGDCDPEEVAHLARVMFADWSCGGMDAPRAPGRVPTVAATRRRIIKDREQAHVALGHLSVARSDPRLYALRVLDVVLGDGAGFASRLPTRLREDEGLAYLVESDSSSTAGLDPGIFWSYAATAPDQVDRVVHVILDEIERIRTVPPTDDERDVAVSFLLGRHLLDRESIESYAVRLAAIERYGLGLDYDDRYAEIISSITADDVRRAAAEVIRPDDLTLVVVGPRG